MLVVVFVVSLTVVAPSFVYKCIDIIIIYTCIYLYTIDRSAYREERKREREKERERERERERGGGGGGRD